MVRNFKPTGDYIYDKQVLNEIYETKFGIHDHLAAGSALSSVSMHKRETYTKDFLYDNYLRTFIFRDIGRKLSISFDEYINRPRYQIEAINRIAEEIDNRKQSANSDVLEELEKNKAKKAQKSKAGNDGLPFN